jgi:hypothetical protein
VINRFISGVEIKHKIFSIVSGGNILNNTPCEKFYSYWKAKNYFGFPSEGMARTRSYVPHLIDAVQTYFFVIDNLIKANISVTKDAVLMALNGSGPGFEKFEGCSGTVSFDNSTGSRSNATQLPEYHLVSLTPKYWEVFLNHLPLIFLCLAAQDSHCSS